VVQMAGGGAEGHVRLGAVELLLELVHVGDGGGTSQSVMIVRSAAAFGDGQVVGHVLLLLGGE
jgi:hypothetical protein